MEFKKLDNINVEIIDGDRGKNYPNGNDFKKGKYCLFLNAKNVTENGFNFSDVTFINKEKDNILRKGKLERKDIVLTTRGTVGNVAYYSDNVPYKNIRINSGMVIIRCMENIIPKYLYYALKSKYVQEQINRVRTGSAQPQLPISILKNIKVNISNLDVQKKIVKILEAIDNKIELNNHINDNLQKYIKEFYKEYFRDENETDILKNVVNFSQGVQVPIEEQYIKLDNGLVRFIRIVDLTQGGKDNIRYIDNKNRGIVKYDDIFMIRYGSPGIMGWNYEGIIANNLFKINPKNDRVTKNYLYCYFNDNEIQNYIKQNATSSTMPAINFSLLYDRLIVIPSKEKLQEFDKIIENVRLKELEIINENNVLSNLRDTLLPKLMNGEIDLDKIKI